MSQPDWDESAYAALCQQWAKRETWTLRQFLCLLVGADPGDPQKQRDWRESRLQAIDPKEYRQRLRILESCRATLEIPVGEKLDEHTPCSKVKLLQIAKGQRWNIPPQLERAALSSVAAEISHPTKDARLKSICEFIEELFQRGSAQDLRFAVDSKRCIPVTKSDFFSVFLQEYPQYRGPVLDTLKDDFKDERLKGKVRFSARKDNPNNIVAKLFPK